MSPVTKKQHTAPKKTPVTPKATAAKAPAVPKPETAPASPLVVDTTRLEVPAGPPRRVVIGYDPGNGNTNVCVDGKEASIQSSVARPVDVGLTAMGMKSAGSRTNLVEWDSERFIVGPGSWYRGTPLNLILGDYYHTLPRRALLYAALSQVLPEGSDPSALEAVLVIGLPTSVLQNEQQAALTKAGLLEYKGSHHFRVDGKEYAFTISTEKGSIEIMNQPVGSFLDWRLGDDLKPVAGHRGDALVFDIGMGTLDIVALGEDEATGRVNLMERFVVGADLGVHWLLRAIAEEAGVDLAEVDAKLRDGKIKVKKEQMDTWLSELFLKLREKDMKLKRFDAVIPTGGGALMLGDTLRLALTAKGAKVAWPANPLTANVRGFWKHGQSKINRKLAA